MKHSAEQIARNQSVAREFKGQGRGTESKNVLAALRDAMSQTGWPFSSAQKNRRGGATCQMQLRERREHRRTAPQRTVSGRVTRAMGISETGAVASVHADSLRGAVLVHGS